MCLCVLATISLRVCCGMQLLASVGGRESGVGNDRCPDAVHHPQCRQSGRALCLENGRPRRHQHVRRQARQTQLHGIAHDTRQVPQSGLLRSDVSALIATVLLAVHRCFCFTKQNQELAAEFRFRLVVVSFQTRGFCFVNVLNFHFVFFLTALCHAVTTLQYVIRLRDSHYCCRQSCVVCLSIFFTIVSLAETAEPIEMHLKRLVVDSRHGTGSLGHRVNGSFRSSFTSGSPGHHFDPV